MDQIKIGKFIAERRKSKKLTQFQLAEKLNITDRAISKWENGKSMPDSGIMLDLCKELEISVNELLSGEMIDMKDYDKKAEENLYNLNKSNEHKKKLLIRCGIIMILLIIIIAIIELYIFTRQIAKANLDTILNSGEVDYEQFVKLHELEEKVDELEQKISVNE